MCESAIIVIVGIEASTGLDLEPRRSSLRALGQRQCEDDRDECEHEGNGEIVAAFLRHELGGGREEDKKCGQDKQGQVTWQARRIAAESTDRAIAHARRHLVEETYSAALAVRAGEHGRRGLLRKIRNQRKALEWMRLRKSHTSPTGSAPCSPNVHLNLAVVGLCDSLRPGMRAASSMAITERGHPDRGQFRTAPSTAQSLAPDFTLGGHPATLPGEPARLTPH